MTAGAAASEQRGKTVMPKWFWGRQVPANGKRGAEPGLDLQCRPEFRIVERFVDDVAQGAFEHCAEIFNGRQYAG